MYLNPTEEDRPRVFTAAELARRTLARGLKLNASEVTALICDKTAVHGTRSVVRGSLVRNTKWFPSGSIPKTVPSR